MPHRVRNLNNPFDRLDSLMNILRVECDWDKKQTLQSLRKYTLEETHEVLEAVEKAIETDEWDDLKGELGDVLIQIAFYAVIAKEQEKFDLADVFDTLIEKMIYRHPHVFADANPDDINEQWEQLKDAKNTERKSLMDGVPPLPALSYAAKQQQRAARVGFDWPDLDGVTDKIKEEVAELEHEINASDGSEEAKRKIEDEFGDVLFSLVNYARKLGVDPEQALMRTNRKFDKRFRGMEAIAENQNIKLKDLNIDALEDIYQQAKDELK
ncbi:nucleoside triphosphate pyrophosphohydrolase [Ghiorsea bivora]|uniref:nucleoside triphosphate pyrophosphohydrolase n=1 Tax=Ghiorsea bivora TaxID=1485545 RepID=UPI00056ED667|nr:nucleoside triphosphate pyrophosphohydrolase [Ghiorsea bivora]